MTRTNQPDKAAAVVLLAQGMSTQAVGRELGIDGRRIRRWREDPTFRDEIDNARRALLAESVGALTAAVREAIDVLRATLTDDSAGIRVRAAAELLKALPAIAHHAELDARLAAVEARLEEQEGRNGLRIV